MRSGVWLAVLGLMAAACGGVAARSDPNQTTTNGKDRAPPDWSDAGPGACSTARAYVSCTSDSGGCDCLSDDPTTCAACAKQLPGPLTCESKCAANEYAAGCGGPPRAGVSYQSAPAECRVFAPNPGGGQIACCPYP